MEKQAFYHLFLVKTPTQEKAKSGVEEFLKKYQLLRYESFSVEEIFHAKEEAFFRELERGLKKNEETLKNFLQELSEEGYTSLFELQNLPQGYLSKVLHLIAHLLDGFFGIDSYFYNLIEDSHRISPSLLKALKENPEEYYLVKVKGLITKPVSMFELLSPKKFLER